jgi:hypothetical protein
MLRDLRGCLAASDRDGPQRVGLIIPRRVKAACPGIVGVSA